MGDLESDLDLLVNECEVEDENSGIETLTRSKAALAVGRKISGLWMQKWIVGELWKQIKLAVPVMVTLLFSQSVFFISNVFVGHLSDDPINLDVSGLGFTFVNMIGVSVGVGLSTAADTLFAQTYGNKNYKRVGIILQRAILILLLTVFPVIVLCLNSEFLLLLIQQQPCVARLAAMYVKILSIAIPIIFILTLLQLYLQAQSIVLIFVVVGVVLNIASAVFHPLFLYVLNWGVLGAAAALVVAHLLALAFLLLYIRQRGLHRKTWDGWSWSSLREWWPFLRLGLPGMLMICLEWWAFEIGTVVCGILGRTELAVNSILFNTLAIVYMVGLGVSVAATVRVGNELGAGNPTGAKRAAYVSLALGSVVSTASGVLFLVCRHELGKIFTSKQEVIEGVAYVCYIAGPLLFFDLVMITASGVLKGLGKQLVGAITNFASYYIIGMPLGIYLALYKGMGVMGVWIGLAVADFIQMTVFLLVILTTNWKKQSVKAVNNAQNGRTVSAQDESLGSSFEQQDELEGNNNDKHNHSTESNVDQENVMLDHISISSGTSQEEAFGVGDDSRMLSSIDVNGTEEMRRVITSIRERLSTKTKLWLLASKGVWFILGSVLVVVAGLVSHFESKALPATNCTNITTGNYTL